jgi:hypothetical protein
VTTLAEGLARLAWAVSETEQVARHLAEATTHKRFKPRKAKPVLDDLATALSRIRETLYLLAEDPRLTTDSEPRPLEASIERLAGER